MKSKQEGFLALEAVVALAIVCIALTAMVTCLSGLKKLEQESSQRANQALAYRMQVAADGHGGGLTLFGRGFGNYGRDIAVSVEYE